MERVTHFADVILPLALAGPLTYRVPQELQQLVQPGIRVIVKLGEKKLYTGIVERVHQEVPKHYQAKYLEELLDEQPVVTPLQLEMWKWICHYYCCTPGDVMNAALPAGLKLASETRISPVHDFIADEQLTTREWQLLELLRAHKGGIVLKDLPAALGMNKYQGLIKSLIEKGAIAMEEELKEKYKPRMVSLVSSGPAASSEKQLQEVFAELEKRNARKQVETLMIFLQMAGWDEGRSTRVEQIELQKRAGVNASVIKNMAEKGIFEITQIETDRLNAAHTVSEGPRTLSEAQKQALQEIKQLWQHKEVVLLHGVTSSGKTELYANLIDEVLARGQQVLYLLPEIALTTQMIGRLKQYFGERAGIYHSGYNTTERTTVWYRTLAGTAGESDLIIGARSALFLPYRRLGLIIVDEEHENSYKQHDPAPRYHARDTAIMLGKLSGAKILLGSATPAIETYWNAKQGKYGLVEMHERYGGSVLPQVELSNLREAKKSGRMKSLFTPELIAEMKRALNEGGQIILFQNRRGYSPMWQCTVCDWVPHCTRCDVSLTYHKAQHRLVCHYCGYTSNPPTVCESCGSSSLRMLGFGTEKLEEEVALLLPDARVARMDLDTTRSRNSFSRILDDFDYGRIQVLCGTQMVTKGLDFGNVSLVGIMNADRMMNFPDFRSLERSYQLMAQVAGRAGRKQKQGKVIIQTYNPSHWLFEKVVHHDYKGMYQLELAERSRHHYPPFTRLIRFTLKHSKQNLVNECAQHLGAALQRLLPGYVLGPEAPLVPRIRNLYLQQLYIKLPRTADATHLKDQMVLEARQLIQTDTFKPVRLVIDVDPM